MVNELCNSTSKKTRNTGATEQCFEGLLEIPFLAKKKFRFATLAESKSLLAWKNAIKNKDIVPLFDAHAVAQANTAAKKFEEGNFTHITDPAVKKTKLECYLGLCSHRALKSFNNSEYTQVFEFLKGGGIVCVDAGSGKIKGQELSDLYVGIRNIATKDKPPFTEVEFTYKDYNELEDGAIIINPDWDKTDLYGVFDVKLIYVSSSATALKFKAVTGCGTDLVTDLVSADLVLKTAAGAVITPTFVAADTDGVYQYTGVSLADNSVLAVNGVVTKPEIFYEGENTITFTFGLS